MKPIIPRSTKPKLMLAALPSTAKMLVDVRAILVGQLTRYKEKSDYNTFDLAEVKAVGELLRAVTQLDAHEQRTGEALADQIENASPAELEALTQQAQKFLQLSPEKPAVISDNLQLSLAVNAADGSETKKGP